MLTKNIGQDKAKVSVQHVYNIQFHHGFFPRKG